MIKIRILPGIGERPAAVCKDYWRLTDKDDFALSNSEVCKKYNISQATLNKVLRRGCQVHDSSIQCRKCNDPILISCRTTWNSLKRKPKLGANKRICAACNTSLKQERREALQELERDYYVGWRSDQIRITESINAEYGEHPSFPTNVHSLSLIDAVYLLSMFNLCGSDNFDRLNPLIEATDKLTPTQELDDLVVLHLQIQRLIGIHTESSPEAFREASDGSLVAIKPMVIWRPLFAKEPADIAAFLEQLREKLISDEWPDHWIDEAPQFCQEVALQECLHVLIQLTSERKLAVGLGEKTRSNLTQILKLTSVGQCASIINYCVKAASDYMVKDGVSSLQAANSISNNLIKRYHWLVDRGFEPYTWTRWANNPESELSRVLFSIAMKAGHDWFATPVADICASRGVLQTEV